MTTVKESAKNEETLAEIKVFSSSEFGSVRTMLIDGEPFFVGKDVATNLEEIGHLGKATKIGEQKIFKRLLDDGYIKVRYSTEGVKCYDPCYGYEKYFETLHVPFLRGDKKLSRDKLMLTHKGFMFFRAKYAPREMIEKTADKWIEREGGK